MKVEPSPAGSKSALHIHTAAPPVPARKNFIFFDFENVQESDLSRIRHDHVILVIVVGEKQKNLPISFTEFLQKHPGQLRLVKTPRQGKNALDFVLAYEIGQIISEDPEAYIHIISKDRGFDALIAHLKSNNRLAARHPSITEIPILFSTEERLERLIDHLKDASRTRPRKLNTLENTVQQHFDKSLAPEVVDKTIKLLIRDKILTLSEAGKVEYP